MEASCMNEFQFHALDFFDQIHIISDINQLFAYFYFSRSLFTFH